MGMIKGGVRRVFSRSELRKKILNLNKVEHSDTSRPRVKTWYYCSICGILGAGYEFEVDHISPIVRVTETLQEVPLLTLIDRTWCEENNLQAIDKNCHKLKTVLESKQRREYKKCQKPTIQSKSIKN